MAHLCLSLWAKLARLTSSSAPSSDTEMPVPVHCQVISSIPTRITHTCYYVDDGVCLLCVLSGLLVLDSDSSWIWDRFCEPLRAQLWLRDCRLHFSKHQRQHFLRIVSRRSNLIQAAVVPCTVSFFSSDNVVVSLLLIMLFPARIHWLSRNTKQCHFWNRWWGPLGPLAWSTWDFFCHEG